MASAEADRFASLSKEDFELNLVQKFFKLVRIVVKTCLLLILFLFFNITAFEQFGIINTYLLAIRTIASLLSPLTPTISIRFASGNSWCLGEQ
jgi:hypothetical protein